MRVNYRKLLMRLLIFGLLVNPLIFWPWANVVFEIPKVLIVNRWIETLGLTSLLVFPFILKKEKIDIKLIALILIFALYLFVSSILGLDFTKSLIGNYYRADGLFTVTHLVIFSLVVSLLFEKDLLKKIAVGIALGSGLASLLAIIPIFPKWDGAVGSTFGNPNFLAGYLVMTLPLIFWLIIEQTKPIFKVTFIFILIFQIAAILLTKSWSGFIGLLLSLIGLLVSQKNKKLGLILLITLFLAVTLMSYWNSVESKKVPGNIIAEGRTRILAKALIAFSKRPILGWGWANFDYAFESVDWPIRFNNDVYVDKAHSHFLEILVTSGIIGLSLYLAVLAKAFLNLVRSDLPGKKYITLAFILFIIHSQTNVISISEELIFWLFLGLASKSSGG